MDKRTAPTSAVTPATSELLTSAQAASLDLHALTGSLSPAQYQGRACISCGAADTHLKPAGKLLDRDVVECETHIWEREDAANPPAWLTTPCPPWCVDKHRGGDHPDDRNHGGDISSTALTTMDFENFGSPGKPKFRPVELMATLTQNYRETEARVVVSGTDDKGSYYLSLAEAEAHARAVLHLVAEARGETTPE
ncbi:DUF6907 domain-containing protein [Streptosporangium sandarakinum]|uniref:DUF6907 domain-containing protein n=1 Tax=Streptosporangium sandarakinum TaxID=1260955 RepID=UPI003679CD84